MQGRAATPLAATGAQGIARPTTTPLDRLYAQLAARQQVYMPVTHRFAPGLYLREIFMPAGAGVIGARHKTEHFNIILTGRARVRVGNTVWDVAAGDVFKSAPGAQKALYIIEDMRWVTAHPTQETDIEKLEAELIEVSDQYLAHKQQMEELELALATEVGRAIPCAPSRQGVSAPSEPAASGVAALPKEKHLCHLPSSAPVSA